MKQRIQRIKKYIAKHFYNLSLQKKIFIPFCALFVLITLILFFASYGVSRSIIKDNATSLLNLFASQIETQVNETFDNLEALTFNIQGDASLISSIRVNGTLAPYDQILIKQKVDTQLSIIQDQVANLERILCISATGRIYYKTTVSETYNLNLLNTQSWYQNILNANGSAVLSDLHDCSYSSSNISTPVVSYGKVIKDIVSRQCCVLIFDIIPSNFLSLSPEQLSIIEEYGFQIRLTNSEGNVIYSYPEIIDSIPAVDTIEVSSNTSRDVFTTITVPPKSLYYKLIFFQWLAILILIPLLMLSVWISYHISNSITAPIHDLIRSMESFENGSYTQIFVGNRTDEIGKMANCYNDMLSMIQKLINDIFMKELQKKEAQYESLQRQIHPHMLYNTLENIRMTAIFNNDHDTAEKIVALGHHLRLVLAETKVTYCIADELDFVQSYLDIINLRQKNKIQLVYKLSDTVLQNKIIRNIVQPIIENSVVHGFSDMQNECIITISAEMKQSALFLNIEDNGIGIEPEILSEIREQLATTESTNETLYMTTVGIGLKNIASRIKLEYGANYSLSIDSEPLFGTTVTLLIPVDTALGNQ